MCETEITGRCLLRQGLQDCSACCLIEFARNLSKCSDLYVVKTQSHHDQSVIRQIMPPPHFSAALLTLLVNLSTIISIVLLLRCTLNRIIVATISTSTSIIMTLTRISAALIKTCDEGIFLLDSDLLI